MCLKVGWGIIDKIVFKGFVMSVRISKSIMGLRFSTSLSQNEKRPTQAELAAAEKEQFLEKISDVCNNSWLLFLEECGYTKQTIVYALNNGGEIVDFVADEENQTIFLSLFDLKKELETLLNKVRFSNVLTAKRREEMTNIVFEIYNLVNTAKKLYTDDYILKIIAERKNKPYDVVLKEKNKTKLYTEKKLSIGKKIFYAFAFLFSGLLSLASIASYSEIASGKTNNSTAGVVFVLLMSTPLIVTILFYRKQKRS